MDFSNDIDSCLRVLKSGGIILYPTDTIWGIGCDATNEEAVEKIFTVKERPSNKSLIVLVADEREVLKHVANPDLRIFEHLQNISKPTTVIYENAIGLAANLVADDGTVAIRIVKDEFCKHLVKRFRKPIVSTSANISGQDPPKNFRDISEEITRRIDYVVGHRQNEKTEATSSAIIQWKGGKPVVIRS
jgi:L-threonylcarbamoyladenylate synthase